MISLSSCAASRRRQPIAFRNQSLSFRLGVDLGVSPWANQQTAPRVCAYLSSITNSRARRLGGALAPGGVWQPSTASPLDSFQKRGILIAIKERRPDIFRANVQKVLEILRIPNLRTLSLFSHRWGQTSKAPTPSRSIFVRSGIFLKYKDPDSNGRHGPPRLIVSPDPPPAIYIRSRKSFNKYSWEIGTTTLVLGWKVPRLASGPQRGWVEP